jgi:kynurenine formamidase
MMRRQFFATITDAFSRSSVTSHGKALALLLPALAIVPAIHSVVKAQDFTQAQDIDKIANATKNKKPKTPPGCETSKYIDLSHIIENSPETVPENLRIQIEYHSHAEGAQQAMLFGVPPSLLRNGEAWATETFTRLGTHDSTHLDSPWHYNSEIGGQTPRSIEELPLDWFFNDGVKLDFTAKGQGEAITVEDIQAELQRISYKLKPMDIVLIYTGRDQFYYDPLYQHIGVGVTAEATKWLYDQGIRVMGIDSWGWDRPLYLEAQDAIAANAQGIFWAAHQVNLEYVHMERLVNLACVPAKKFKVAAFPLKIKDGSGGPARVVAIVK